MSPAPSRSPGVLSNLLAPLQGLQSDADFAEVFARSKWRQSRWAPSRIRMELVKRGVAKQHIEAGLESVFGVHSERLNADFQEAEAPDLSALQGGLKMLCWLPAAEHEHLCAWSRLAANIHRWASGGFAFGLNA